MAKPADAWALKPHDAPRLGQRGALLSLSLTSRKGIPCPSLYLALLEHCADSSEATEPKGGSTMTDAKKCERCGPQKATTHLEFRYSGAWNACASCAQKLIAFHATGGKYKRTRRQGKIMIIPGWPREKPLNPERRTVKRSAGSRLWGPGEWARRARKAA